MLFAGSPALAGNNVESSLAFETAAPAPGSTVRVAIVLEPKKGWHSYWINPGDAGAALRVKWSAPKGVEFSNPLHPAPHLMNVQGIASYVHEGWHGLLLEMKVPEGLTQGSPFPISAKLDWLACSDTQCVPETKTIEKILVIGMGETDFPGLSQIRKAEARLPGSIDNIEYYRDGDEWVFSIPGVKSGAQIFAESSGWFSPSSTQVSSIVDGKTVIRVSSLKSSPSSKLSGIIVNGDKAWKFASAREVSFPVENDIKEDVVVEDVADISPDPVLSNTGTAVMVSKEEISASPSVNIAVIPSEPNDWIYTSVLALLGALIGGLLLNLMPCVFPILSLKALSLARASSSEKEARIEGIGYALGSVVTTSVFGAIILGLKYIGISAGWSFQLQSPIIVFVLLMIVILIALNLSGLFEFRMPFGIVGDNGKGLKGSFATGSLAAFIATPCSGPFMAGALGAVLVLPFFAGMLVFAGLGLGMAIPFLVIAFVPSLRNRLPKPGQWMVILRKALAIPMFMTAAWLIWVLSAQTDMQGLLLIAVSAFLMCFGLSWFGRLQIKGKKSFPAAVLSLIAIALVPIVGLPQPSVVNAKMSDEGLVQKFSIEKLEDLRAEEIPVFVDFTAEWCLTCKVNEKIAINKDETKAAFEKAGVVTLVGDWTNGDPEITEFLESQGRNSIPFYLFYEPAKDGEVLPQILSVEILKEKATQSASE